MPFTVSGSRRSHSRIFVGGGGISDFDRLRQRGACPNWPKCVPPYRLDAVILSHLHHDHIADFFVLQYADSNGDAPGMAAGAPPGLPAPVHRKNGGISLPIIDAIQLHPIQEGEEYPSSADGKRPFFGRITAFPVLRPGWRGLDARFCTGPIPGRKRIGP